VISHRCCLYCLAALLLIADVAAEPIKLIERTKHLGVAGQSEWSIFEGRTPDGTNLVLTFDLPSDTFTNESTLLIRQDDVKQEWTVTLNDRRLGHLFQMEASLVYTMTVPSTLLRRSDNRLEINARAADDILVHEILLHPGPKASIFTNVLNIHTHELGPGKAFPVRITITDAQGHLAAFHDFAATNLAARPGVIYSATGSERIALQAGKYTVHVGHGPEYSVDSEEINVPDDKEVDLAPTRQVDTTGWIAADTHIHTLSLSKHGDATVHERVITLAAEGIDLPIVTEHNLHADYSQAAADLNLSKYFTIVPGNEVTTKKGHFNIFPVSLSAPPPDHTIEDWSKLMDRIRQTPDVRVAILNHPTDTHSGFTPFAPTNLNLVTGRNLRGDYDFTFDAMEVINSGAMRSDWMEPFHAWFALLNRGHRITAIGASDSHDVSRFIVGQGRTYIFADDEDPSKIDVNRACENLKRGRAVVSLGLFPGLTISEPESGAAGPGEMLTIRGGELHLTGTFACPSWITPAKTTIYANGQRFAEHRVNPPKGRPQNVSFQFKAPKPKRDTYFVLITEGPGVTNQFWSVARPYQPTSRQWQPLVIGATNPVWVDGDGDGKFTSAREYAERMVALPREQLLLELATADWAIAAQAAELLGVDAKELKLIAAILPSPARDGFNDYLKTVQ
jgi:hypothetical protein